MQLLKKIIEEPALQKSENRLKLLFDFEHNVIRVNKGKGNKNESNLPAPRPRRTKKDKKESHNYDNFMFVFAVLFAITLCLWQG